jgi:very-short-patch-repair endonuclease
MNIDNFIGNNGNVSSAKTTEKYVKKHFVEEYIKIDEHANRIGLTNCIYSEKIYHYLNDLKEVVACRNCKIVKTKFKGLVRGYQDYCSSICSNSSDEVKKLKEASYIDKFGVNNPSKSEEIIQKIQKTFDEKYGGNPFTLDSFKTKIKATNILKYSAEYPMQKNSTLRKSIDEKNIKKAIFKYKELKIIGIESKKYGDVKIECDKCNSIFTISKWNLHQRTNSKLNQSPCTICYPIGDKQNSMQERFIEKLLIDNNIPYKKGDRKILKGTEIDFYIEKYRIGIEIDGLYWHSDKFKDNEYHLRKTEESKESNINLIHIFEDEINNKPNIVSSRLLSIFGKYENTIFARKCKIIPLNSKDSNDFLDKNHMQGKCGASFRYGLEYNGELISVMTFGELRKNLGNKKEEGSYELIRFCTKTNTSVIGGASKLLKHFINKNSPKKIISYCDRRWSNGEFYEKIGFNTDHVTKPNYWYTKNGFRENRFKYRKDILVKEGYDTNKTESSIMKDRGFLRIYDCGSYKYTMQPSYFSTNPIAIDVADCSENRTSLLSCT